MIGLKHQQVNGIDSGIMDHLEIEIHNVNGLKRQLVIGIDSGIIDHLEIEIHNVIS